MTNCLESLLNIRSVMMRVVQEDSDQIDIKTANKVRKLAMKRNQRTLLQDFNFLILLLHTKGKETVIQ